MKMKSKGIDGDIDLTENGTFRRGVCSPLTMDELKPAKLPWDRNGKYANKISYDLDSYERLWLDTSYEGIVEIINNDLVFDGDGIEYDDQYDQVAEVLRRMQKKRIERVRESTDPEMLRLLNLDRIHIKDGRVIHDTDSRYVRNVGWKPGKTWALASLTYSSTTGSISLNNTTSSTSLYNTASISARDGDDITPTIFGTTRLTEDEWKGRTLITGRGDELCRKLDLYAYISVVRDMLESHQSVKNRRSTCECCGKQFVYTPKWGGKLSICQTCAFAEELKLTLDHFAVYRQHACMKDFVKQDMSAEKFDKHHSFAEMDQSSWASCREDKTIDYFFQEVYRDRGIHLLRRPRNSHELRVNLDNGEYADEEDYVRGSSELTYEKAHIDRQDGYVSDLVTLHTMLGEPTMLTGNITVNRHGWL